MVDMNRKAFGLHKRFFFIPGAKQYFLCFACGKLIKIPMLQPTTVTTVTKGNLIPTTQNNTFRITFGGTLRLRQAEQLIRNHGL